MSLLLFCVEDITVLFGIIIGVAYLYKNSRSVKREEAKNLIEDAKPKAIRYGFNKDTFHHTSRKPK